MIVKIIEHTPNPEVLIATAAKLCYSDSNLDELFRKQTPEEATKFVEKLINMGHESPIEHVSFTFVVEGVSRSLTHQLVRHRIASYSQQSQRYVKLNQFEYVIPPEIEKVGPAKTLFINHMLSSQLVYDNLVTKLYNSYCGEYLEGTSLTVVPKNKQSEFEKKAIEDARYAFPNACCSKVMFTMNARTLLNFFKHRCCNRAQWEIRQLADLMLEEVKCIAPTVFKYAGAACVHGSCTEGQMTCGNSRKQL